MSFERDPWVMTAAVEDDTRRRRRNVPRWLDVADGVVGILGSILRMASAIGAVFLGVIVTALGVPMLGVPGIVIGSTMLTLAMVDLGHRGRSSGWVRRAAFLAGDLSVLYVMTSPILLLVAIMESLW